MYKTQQIQTNRALTVKQVFNKIHFQIGYNDYKNNKGWNSLYDTWTMNEQWAYERGRQVAAAGVRSPFQGRGFSKKAMGQVTSLVEEFSII